MRKVCVHLDDRDYKIIQALIKKGYFVNPSEFIRHSVKNELHRIFKEMQLTRELLKIGTR